MKNSENLETNVDFLDNPDPTTIDYAILSLELADVYHKLKGTGLWDEECKIISKTGEKLCELIGLIRHIEGFSNIN